MKHLSKRKFLKELGIVTSVSLLNPFTCGLTTGSKINLDQSGYSSKLGVALVGLGYYSTDLLAPALQETQYCELRGIVTGSPEKIPGWQRQYNISDRNIYNYENMHQIANNDDIDVIYIVVPTGLHRKYAVIAANTGKHVWCEKPMAMNVAECEEIINACNANKVKLSIGYRIQHVPNMQEIIKLTKTQVFGPITGMNAEAGYRGGTGTGWRFRKDMGGGALYDMGVYTINALRHAGQMEPERVVRAAHSTNRPKAFHEVDETTTYTLEFPGGVLGTGRTSVGESFNELDIQCTEGSYYLRPLQTYNGVRGGRSDGVLIDIPLSNQQALQMDNDALSIIQDRDVLVPGEDGLKDIRIVNAIQKAAHSGAPVSIE